MLYNSPKTSFSSGALTSQSVPFWILNYLITGCFLFLLSNFTHAQQISLNGNWNFALDPTKSGEKLDWYMPWKPIENSPQGYSVGWDIVEVPHCFSTDQRYEGYIGTVWYRKMFEYKGDISQKHLRLHFDAVFYQCRIWLNGKYVGIHEGGYTPFEFDITEFLQEGNNYLAVEVNNAWDHTTIPGARLGNEYASWT